MEQGINDALARELYDEGKADKDIAEICGVCPSTVFEWRKRNRLKSNKSKKILRYGAKALYAVYERGVETCILMDVTVDEICSALRIKESTFRTQMSKDIGRYEFIRMGTRRGGKDEYY